MKKLLIIFLASFLVFFLLAAGAGTIAYQQLLPAKPNQNEKVNFVVPKGQSTIVIGQRLQSQGLIKNSLAFRYIVWREKLGNKIQAGTFFLSPSMSVMAIAQELTTGTNDLWVKVLEGWRVEEIADSLRDQKVSESLDNFDRQEFLNLAKSQEGYLFPDSYLVPRAASADTIVTLLRNTFDKKVQEGLKTQLAQSKLSLADVVTFASLVQREAGDPTQMKVVAGILQNRLDKGMGLNVDATLQYAKGYDSTLKTWWPQPLAADREISSPFNSYKYNGLPPHPICNPGLDAIQAVLSPQKSNNLYYIHDRQGNIHVAVTLEEQTKNINTYLR